MSTYHANSSGRRQGRGPRRNRGRGDDYRPNPQPGSRSEPPAPAPASQSLWQKIVGFFKPKKAPSASSSRPAAPRGTTSVTSNYPAQPGARRNDRGDRDREERGDRRGREERAPREERDGDSSPAPRGSRKPEAVEVTTPKLYIGNLSFDATENDLSELFNGVGAVQSAEIVTHKQTEKSKGFAFITMASVEEAKRAVEVLHDKDFMGRKLVVSGAKTPTER